MKLNVITTFSGYDSQCLALDEVKNAHEDFDYDLVAWSEIDKYAIQGHNLLFPKFADRNQGDITKVDWKKFSGKQIDLLTYSSPCVTKDSLILTKDGYRTMESVAVGMEVLTKSGKWHRVAKKFDNGVHQTCYISGVGFENIHCTLNHKFYVRKVNGKLVEEPEFVEAKDLTKGCYLGLPIDTTEQMPRWEGVVDNRWGHQNISNRLSGLFSNERFWYLMGRYVGDGWKKNSSTGNGINICCGGRYETELTDAFDACGLHYSVTQQATARRYTVCSNELNAFVDRYGYYAHGKRIDGETMCLPKHLLKGFLDGIEESDGCFTENRYKLTTTSRELAYGVQFCIAKVYGRHTTLYKSSDGGTGVIEGRTVNCKPTYQVCYTKAYSPRESTFVDGNMTLWFPFKKLEMANLEHVYNMEVEEDHSYIIHGCISKNCQDISQAGKQMGLQEGSETRSSLLWNVIDAIRELRPKYLLQENVAALVSKKFLPDFGKWCERLEQYGYKNYWAKMNAKDYGVPQNRERVFMISIRDDIAQRFKFPEPFALETKLADILEDNVDESYFLSDEAVEKFLMTSEEFHKKPDFSSDKLKAVDKENLDENGLPRIVIAPSGKEYHLKYNNGHPEWEREETDKDGVTHVYGIRFRIRKLTPRECFRLMGVPETRIDQLLATERVPETKGSEKMVDRLVISKSQLYKMAGNSIVVDCMKYIFENLFYPTYLSEVETRTDNVGQGLLEFDF